MSTRTNKLHRLQTNNSRRAELWLTAGCGAGRWGCARLFPWLRPSRWRSRVAYAPFHGQAQARAADHAGERMMAGARQGVVCGEPGDHTAEFQEVIPRHQSPIRGERLVAAALVELPARRQGFEIELSFTRWVNQWVSGFAFKRRNDKSTCAPHPQSQLRIRGSCWCLDM